MFPKQLNGERKKVRIPYKVNGNPSLLAAIYDLYKFEILARSK